MAEAGREQNEGAVELQLHMPRRLVSLRLQSPEMKPAGTQRGDRSAEVALTGTAPTCACVPSVCPRHKAACHQRLWWAPQGRASSPKKCKGGMLLLVASGSLVFTEAALHNAGLMAACPVMPLHRAQLGTASEGLAPAN